MVITNIAGSTISSNALLTVIGNTNVAPTIISQPTNQIVVNVGSNAIFRVTATGTAPLRYQWRFNNTNIAGATSSIYTRVNAQLTNAGNYSVVITNLAGSVISSNALLTVIGFAPTITSQPASQTVNAGTNVTFSVVATGTAPLRYQWRFNNTNIAGATASILTRLNVQTANSGNYSVVITNVVGTVLSSDALLTVISNTNIAPTVVFFSPTNNMDFGSTSDIGVYAQVSDVDGIVTNLDFFSGTNLLQTISGNLTNNGGLYGFTWTNVPPGVYSITAAATDDSGAVSTTAPLTFTVGGTLPTITSQPASQTVNAGTNVTFSVVATGTAPLSYQWRFNNTNIAGATSSIFSLSNVQTANAGNYSVVITNIAGITTSSSALLTVIGNPNFPPTVVFFSPTNNMNFGSTSDIGVYAQMSDVDGIVTNLDFFSGTNLLQSFSGSLTNNGGLYGFTWTNVPPGVYSITAAATDDSGAVSTTAPLTFTVGSTPPTITSQPVSQVVNAGTNVTFSVVATGTDPMSYQWLFNNTNIAGATSSIFSLSNVQTTDSGNYSVVITNIAGSTTSSNALLTIIENTNVAPTITSQPASQTVNAGTNVAFSVVATGTAPLHYQWRFNNTNIAGATSNILTRLNVQPTNSGNYSVVITNVAGGIISSNALLTVNAIAPTITSQPASQTVNAGTSVTFSVSATGTAPLRYQWRFNNTNIAGAISSVFTRLNVQTTNAGNYSVVITNLAGTVTSSNALLTVIANTNVAPAITTQPQNQTVAVGQSATFSVVATGTAPLLYQWRFNTTNIPGAQGSSLTLSNVQPSNAGNYSVVITNIAGKVTSSNALLTVIAPVLITAQPQSQAVTEGNAAAFTVSATASTPLQYQWLFNGSPIAGQTNSSLALPGVAAADAGLYSVSISSLLSSVTSSNATLTVTPAVCVPAPAGLVSWWPGEANARDLTDTNNGTLDGSLDFAPGKVGQAFVFNGTDADVKIPASADLNVGAGDGFSIDAWINPSDVTTQRPLVEWNSGSYGAHFWISVPVSSTGAGPGCLYANLSDTDGLDHTITSPAGTILPSTFQHVALTYDKTSGMAVLYVNGNIVAQQNLGTFTPSTTGDLWLGLRPAGDAAGTRFLGRMDEVDLFNRALSATEIQSMYNASFAGKCRTSPLVVTQPASQTVTAGDNATFTVEAAGTGSLHYQWQFAGADLSGATTTSLVISNAQPANAGDYSVLISSAIGSVTSSNATLIVNHAPVANPQSLAVNEDSSLFITLSATDEDADPLTYTVSTPAHGTLTGTAPNLVYQPAAGYYGPDAFTFHVNDGLLDSEDATITIDVRFVNHAPLAESQSVTVNEDSSVAITLTASDVENDPLTYFVLTAPAHGTLTGNGANLVYHPNANYFGPDTFTFKANDGQVDSGVATVTITVNPVNDAPVAVARIYPLFVLSTNDTDLIVIAPDGIQATVIFDGSLSTDIENDPLQFTWLDEGKTNILGQTMVATNTLSVGTNIVSLIVSDGTDMSTNTIQVQVITPAEAVSKLSAVLQEVDLGGTSKDPFLDALNDAQDALGMGQLDKGVSFLEKFEYKVSKQTSPVYTESVARLIYIANEIIQAVTPPSGNPQAIKH
ncbi:beta strand repeat-containing protein [Pedosphaera parvula]|uniref:Immunoglobulin I-set domain protein n=1 Tax=Pedosphaera parvula (strain Ellin514) TaxID=320771 RepID=B9XJN0_PEDPL|nr:immunoglobulin domain-containing protein [Pedosphaera parvula]EEF59906.1 Immunoglobulin I-set domain protein [Pedosphaera parvula Ellin514]